MHVPGVAGWLLSKAEDLGNRWGVRPSTVYLGFATIGGLFLFLVAPEQKDLIWFAISMGGWWGVALFMLLLNPHMFVSSEESRRRANEPIQDVPKGIEENRKLQTQNSDAEPRPIDKPSVGNVAGKRLVNAETEAQLQELKALFERGLIDPEVLRKKQLEFLENQK